VRKRIITIALLAYFAASLAAVFAVAERWRRERVEPAQPIAFSHRLHVARNGINCDFCHGDADRGSQAGAPAMSVCAGCHAQMRSDNAEIAKLQESLREDRVVPWNKVHALPSHALFTHKRHVRRDIDCRTCHGEVRAMDRVRRMRSLSMGWCVACHRKNGAPDDCVTCHR
jgi:hypothetical protein